MVVYPCSCGFRSSNKRTHINNDDTIVQLYNDFEDYNVATIFNDTLEFLNLETSRNVVEILEMGLIDLSYFNDPTKFLDAEIIYAGESYRILQFKIEI